MNLKNLRVQQWLVLNLQLPVSSLSPTMELLTMSVLIGPGEVEDNKVVKMYIMYPSAKYKVGPPISV